MKRLPTNLLAGLLIDRADYDRLAVLCARDAAFPSWTDWNKLQIRAAAAAQKRGEDPDCWTLDLDDFTAWCRQASSPPCLTGLRSYVHARRVRSMVRRNAS
ncbi:hypothetical protein [Piscinibacter sp. HJYY11]|uniref:hypothetical protein n=1 Tax=Piscinibacter sp. HJYY11 TaxID=2801333 RepID=UPI00191CCC7C|nr:hypothetical protein [Piscinibacter sp. HJYY11]MBL0726478.1 hypothetical protein [Piscinibacter sp. HJYY11]